MDVTIKCPCPAKPDGEPRHDTDTWTLRDKLGFHAARSIREEIRVIKNQDPGVSSGEVLAMMTGHYFIFGTESWTLVDDKDKPVPVSRAAIREIVDLLDFDSAELLADTADNLYASVVLLPLVAQASTSSPPTPTNGSMFHTTGSSKKPPKPSRPSSTTTSQTGATGTITQLPVGGSSSSRKAASAG